MSASRCCPGIIEFPVRERMKKTFWSAHIIEVALIVVLVAGVFAQSVGNGFVWDDIPVIVENPIFKAPNGIWEVLKAEDTIQGSGLSTGYYRPLAYLSFYADSLLWVHNPMGFHVTSLVLHIAVAVALYFFLQTFSPSGLSPLFFTLFFAVNPVMAESVCLVTARNTILCSLFALLAVVAHRRNAVVLSVICTCAAAASKETGFLIPLILFAFDRINGDNKDVVRSYLPHVAAVACLIAVRLALVPTPEPVALSIVTSLLLAPELVVRYLVAFLIPFQQKVAYPVSVVSPSLWSFCGYAAVLVLMIFLVVRRNRSKLVVIGLVWFIVCILPAVLLAPMYKLPMSDRHAYMPMLGIIMLLSASLSSMGGKRLATLMIPVLFLMATLTVIASGVWKDEGTLFSKMVADAPHAETGYTGLAGHYFKSGNIEPAMSWLDRGAAQKALPVPAVQSMKINMMTSHAERLVRENRWAEAESLLLRVLASNPDHVPAIIDYGSIMAEQGTTGEAVRLFLRAAELQPENPVPHFNLSEVYRMRRELEKSDKALREYRRLGGAQ